MVLVVVTYDGEPDADRYARHVELCLKVPGSTFRHGKIVRTLSGTEQQYFAEFEFPDMDAFKAASGSDEFRAAGADAAEMGIPHSIHVVDVA